MPDVPVLSRRQQKDIAALTRKKHRIRQRRFLVEGPRAVASAVAAGAPLTELVASSTRLPALQAEPWYAQLSVPVYQVSDTVLAQLTEVQTPQGVVAVARMTPATPKDLTRYRTLLALDAVQDPGNVGTLVRAAAWFGVDAVVFGAGTADVYSPKVVRATMGGLWDVALAPVPALDETLLMLRKAGFACYGADLEGEEVRQWTPRAPSVLVLGSEAHGLSAAVQGALTARVRITGPQTAPRGVESLNVALAGGILMHHWKSSMPAQ